MRTSADRVRLQQAATEDLLRAVTGRDTARRGPVVDRTRRAIRIADQSRREQGARGRRHVGIVLLVLGLLFIALAPALWTGIDDMLGGERFSDLPAQAVMLYALLMAGVFAALAAFWRARSERSDGLQDY